MKILDPQKRFKWIPVLLVFSGFVLFSISVTAVTKVNDNTVLEAVEDQIVGDIYTGLEGISIQVNERIVTLSGSVDNILKKERTGKIAKMVKGVRAVVNNIRVTPSILRSDGEIEKDIEEALLLDPATDSFQVKVDVSDNIVTLSGEVESWQERNLAEKVAKSIKGVKDVNNKITIDYKAIRPDIELKNEIKKAMEWNVLLDHHLVDVYVKDGRARLTGIVGSAYEKDVAYTTALVVGIRSVNAEDLKVKDWAREEDLRKNRYVVKSDKAIEQALKDAFLYDPRVFSFKVKPEVTNGSVTLRGVVDNLEAKRAAERDARNTLGVYNVKNRIQVSPSISLTDNEIRSTIRKSFKKDPIIDRYDVTILVQNGVVDLYGLVDTFYEKARAENITAKTPGVILVDNKITVSETDRPYINDPFLEDWFTYYDVTHPRYPLFINDYAIREAIESELFWSPFVDEDEVSVAVENGVATLSGAVDSVSELSAAEKNAMEGGAVMVINDLELKPKSG